MFQERDGGYNLRGKPNYKSQTFHRAKKMLSISVAGVKLWNSLNEELKHPFTNMNSLVLPNTGRKSCNVIPNVEILLMSC